MLRHICRRAGVTWNISTSSWTIKSASFHGSIISSSSASTITFPIASGNRLSPIKLSNTTLVVHRIGPAARSNSSRILTYRLDTELCFSMTPFGLPVEPEVNITFTRSEPLTGTSKNLPADSALPASVPPFSPFFCGSTQISGQPNSPGSIPFARPSHRISRIPAVSRIVLSLCSG